MCIHSTHMMCYNHIHKNLEATKETAKPTAETHKDTTKAPSRENQPQEQHCLPASTLPCKAKFCFFGEPAKKHEHKQRHEVPAEDTHTHRHKPSSARQSPRLQRFASCPVFRRDVCIFLHLHIHVYTFICTFICIYYYVLYVFYIVCIHIFYGFNLFIYSVHILYILSFVYIFHSIYLLYTMSCNFLLII